MGLGDIMGSIGMNFSGQSITTNIAMIVIGTLILGSCGFGLWWFLHKRKKWNLKVEVKIPRNIRQAQDGSVIGTLNKEWARGFYDSEKGVCYIIRKGKKPSPMKPFDIKRYLSTGNILTVIQVGMDDYRPVLDEGYLEVKDSETDEEGALILARIDTSESRSWKNSFERECKNTYSIKNWISEHGALLAMGLVLFMNLVGFAIIIARMK
jgi:hypothetical protein